MFILFLDTLVNVSISSISFSNAVFRITYIYDHVTCKQGQFNLFPFWFWCCCLSVIKSCPTLCDPMDCSPPGSSVHGISQARILKWVAISFSRGSSWPKIKPISLALASLSLSHHLSDLDAVYFSYLVALAMTSSTLLNRSGERGHPCFVHSSRGKTFSYSLWNAMLAVDFSYMAFSWWGDFLLFLVCWQLFVFF